MSIVLELINANTHQEAQTALEAFFSKFLDTNNLTAFDLFTHTPKFESFTRTIINKHRKEFFNDFKLIIWHIHHASSLSKDQNNTLLYKITLNTVITTYIGNELATDFDDKWTQYLEEAKAEKKPATKSTLKEVYSDELQFDDPNTTENHPKKSSNTLKPRKGSLSNSWPNLFGHQPSPTQLPASAPLAIPTRTQGKNG